MTPEELAVVQAAMRWRDAVLVYPEALHPLHSAGNPLTPVLSELSRVTYLLAVACPQCNAGGHTCPGDGQHIPHGATDCGEHERDDCDFSEAEGLLADLILDTARGGWLDYAEWLDGSQVKIIHMAGGTVRVVADSGRGDLIGEFAISASARALPPPGPEDDGALRDELAAEAELLNWVPRTWADVRTGDRLRMPGTDMTARVQSAVHLHWYVKPGTGTSLYNPPELLEYAGVRVVLQRAGFASTDPYEMDPAKPIEIELSDHEVIALDALGWHNRVGLVIEVQDVTS